MVCSWPSVLVFCRPVLHPGASMVEGCGVRVYLCKPRQCVAKGPCLGTNSADTEHLKAVALLEVDQQYHSNIFEMSSCSRESLALDVATEPL